VQKKHTGQHSFCIMHDWLSLH